MKKLSKIKLNHLNDDGLKEREMNTLRGGRLCGCGCNYADSGGSTEVYNGGANYKLGDNGGHSPGGSKACYVEMGGIQTSTSQVEYW